MSTLGASILKGSLWIFGGRIATRIIGFFVAIIMARLLPPEDFGLVVTMSLFTGLAGYFAAGGMGSALVRANDANENDFSTVFMAQFAICSAIYCMFYYLAPYFASWFDDYRYEFLFQVSALTFLMRPFNNIAMSIIARQMRFRAISALRLAATIVSSTCGIYLAYNNFGPWALVLSGLLGALVTMPLAMVTAKWRPKIRVNKKSLKVLSVQGIKFSANDIADYVRTQLPNLIISSHLGFAATGLYNRAHSLSSMPIELLGGSSYQVLFRGLAKASGDKTAADLFLKAVAMITLYTMPIFVCLWWLVDPFIIFVYGPNWAESIPTLKVLTLIGLLPIGVPCGALIAARGSLGKEFKLKLEGIALLIAGCAIGLQYGATGVAYAVSINRLYINIRMYSLAKQAAPISWRNLGSAISTGYLVSVIMGLSLISLAASPIGMLKQTSPFLYLISMTIGSCCITVLVSSFLPSTTIKTELKRWFRWLRLDS